MGKMDFSDWIRGKYVEWRGSSIGHEKTVEEFAYEIGVGRSLVSQWMRPVDKKPKKPTSAKAISGLVRLFGDEVYDVLGMKKPYQTLSGSVPTVRQLRALEALIEETFRREGLTGDSPNAETRANEIMAEHGFKYIATTKPEE